MNEQETLIPKLQATFEGANVATDLLAQQEQAAEKSGVSWADSPFGALHNDVARITKPNLDFVPSVPLTPKEQSLMKPPIPTEDREKTHRELREERKEALTESRLSVHLDKDGIKNILHDHPEFSAVDGARYMDEDEITRIEQERKTDLDATIEAISSLPEELTFTPGITLIVGENGLGKSTLARALCYAAEIAEDMDYNPEVDLERAVKLVLEPPKGGGSQTNELIEAGLAPIIARHVSVQDYQGYSYPRYLDASTHFGMSRLNTFDRPLMDKRDSDSRLSRGRSHRQTVDKALFGRLQYAIENSANRINSGRSSQEGPEILFIDEPETGMSPKRQLDIIKTLESSMMRGTTMILPTNSLVLYESDLPRIDLEHPEWGIFKPSEHPGYFE